MPSALSAENPCFLTELARLADSIRDARSSLLRLIDLKVERGAHPALFLFLRQHHTNVPSPIYVVLPRAAELHDIRLRIPKP